MIAVEVLSRWIHILSAVALMGGAIFAVVAVIPTLAGVNEETRKQIKAGIRGRWAKVVHLGIALLLASGFYNYLAVAAPKLQADTKGHYHMLMGIKILIALAVFFFASVLAGKSPKFEAMRQQDRKWLTITLVLAVVVVAIAGYLKIAVPRG